MNNILFQIVIKLVRKIWKYIKIINTFLSWKYLNNYKCFRIKLFRRKLFSYSDQVKSKEKNF